MGAGGAARRGCWRCLGWGPWHFGLRRSATLGKGTSRVGANGVSANFMSFDRGTFWVLPTFILTKVPGRTFFPNLSKSITCAAAPLVLTLLIRSQHT